MSEASDREAGARALRAAADAWDAAEPGDLLYGETGVDWLRDRADRLASEPTDERQCRECGDAVQYLSSRDLCDGCEAEASAHAPGAAGTCATYPDCVAPDNDQPLHEHQAPDFWCDKCEQAGAHATDCEDF